MRRKVSVILLMLFLFPLFISGVTIQSHAQGLPPKSIAVSVSSLAGIVKGIGGSYYNTTVLLEQEADPHAFTLTPEVIAKADDADLLILTGHFHWEEELANLTSTPFISLDNDNALEKYEDFGAALSPMPGGEVSGDSHTGNPHAYWLLPSNALAIANATRAALTVLNASLTVEWNSNFVSFSNSVVELNELISSLDDVYGFSNEHAVVVAPAEAYVAEAFGITADAVLQIEDITLSGSRLLEVQQAIQNGSIDLIIGSDVAQFQTGGEFAYQMQSDYGGILIWWKTIFFAEADYFWMMNYNLGALVSGLEGRSGDVTDNTVNIGLLALSSVLGVLVVIESVLLIIRAKAE